MNMKNFFVRAAERLCSGPWRAPVLCCALAGLFVLATGTAGLAESTAARRQGTLTEQSLSTADFRLVNAHAGPSDTVVSDTEDPQMLYTLPQGQRAESLTMAVTYDHYPYEKCLYYAAEGQDFSPDRRVWPVENADGSFTFLLPRGARVLRLDPGSSTDLHMTFSSLVLNAPRPPLSYYLPEGGWFGLLVWPALAAAVLQGAALACRKQKDGPGAGAF